MCDYMKQLVANVYRDVDNGISMYDIFTKLSKELPKSWQTVLFHYERLTGKYDNFL